MISRKSAYLIGQAYDEKFKGQYHNVRRYEYKLRREELYDFLFESGYEAWFLNLANRLDKYIRRGLLEFIMKLHTGETAVPATSAWSWEARQDLGQRYLKDLAEDILATRQPVGTDTELSRTLAKMVAQLELDGYIYRETRLYNTEGSVINEKSEQGYIAKLISDLRLDDAETIEHHMALAEEHYTEGRWDDSIGNSRKFLESILQQTAASFHFSKNGGHLDPKVFSRPVLVRDFLENEGLLEKKEKETLSNVYGLLSETGSHPYIAAKDQARLMWHLSLTFSQFVLLRYGGYLVTAMPNSARSQSPAKV